jgi:hypothetical protein
MQAQPELAAIPVILLTATNYASDNLGTSSLAIRWAGGLFPADVLSCLRATVGALKPHHESHDMLTP